MYILGSLIGVSMKITINSEIIDITEIPINHHIEWEPVLNDLKAEHMPGFYPDGKRMGVSIVNGQAHVYIYRTDKTPPEPKILEILRSHGIAGEPEPNLPNGWEGPGSTYESKVLTQTVYLLRTAFFVQ
jgi:hypothetical protein